MKKKFKISMITLLAFLLLLLGFGGENIEKVYASTSDENTQTEEHLFKVGMEAGYAPFNWTQMTDDYGAIKIDGNEEFAGGYDVEIAKIIANGLGKELVIVKTEWDGLVPALSSGKIDAIVAGMSPTAERKETIDFTDIYYQSDLVMVVKNGGEYINATSIQDFKGAKITGQLNTFHYDVIEQIDGVIQETAMDNFPAMRVALESGIIDGYVTERPEGVSASSANSNFAMVEFEEGFVTSAEDTAISVGVEKNSELTSQINEILAGISEERRQEIMDLSIANQPASGDDKSFFEWVYSIVLENGPMFLRGAGTTLLISITATILGFIIGLLVGVIKTIPIPIRGGKKVFLKIVNGILAAYIEFFRGTPMIVQAMVIYYGSAIAFDIHMNRLLAAILIVSVNTGAYMSEIIRGGIVSIDRGQYEAAEAVGMNHIQTMANVVLPQTIRNILPATGNEFVINIKDTSVLNVIAVTELFFQTKTVAGNNFRYFESFFVACILYFAMTFIVTRILRCLERKIDGPDNYMITGNQMQTEKAEDALRRKTKGQM